MLERAACQPDAPGSRFRSERSVSGRAVGRGAAGAGGRGERSRLRASLQPERSAACASTQCCAEAGANVRTLAVGWCTSRLTISTAVWDGQSAAPTAGKKRAPRQQVVARPGAPTARGRDRRTVAYMRARASVGLHGCAPYPLLRDVVAVHNRRGTRSLARLRHVDVVGTVVRTSLGSDRAVRADLSGGHHEMTMQNPRRIRTSRSATQNRS